MEQWHVKTEIKESNIVGAGNGRFFCDNYKKGTIVKITSDKIIINNRHNNLSLKKNEYYFFKLPRKHNNKKKFYEELQKFLEN